MTTATEMDRLLTFLCHGDAQKLVNLKFFRGERDLVSPEELCQQVHAALEQKRVGLAIVSEDPPDGEGEPVDVKELVNNL